MILKCWDEGTQCLPPGGRGTAKRWMRNGDTLPLAMQLIQTVQTFPMYLFHEMHTNTEHIAVPHPPQFANWGTFPPGQCHQLKHQGTVYLCHCEERSDVAIRFLLGNMFEIGTLQGERIATPGKRTGSQ